MNLLNWFDLDRMLEPAHSRPPATWRETLAWLSCLDYLVTSPVLFILDRIFPISYEERAKQLKVIYLTLDINIAWLTWARDVIDAEIGYGWEAEPPPPIA